MKKWCIVATLLLIGCSSQPGEKDPIKADLGMDQQQGPPVDMNPDLDNDGNDQADQGMSDLGAADVGWGTAASTPGARQETAVVTLRDRLYMIGGFDEDRQMTPRVDVYDPATDDWSSAQSFPLPLHHANAVVVGEQIWVTGYLVQNFSADGRVFSYDPDADRWVPRGQMLEGRHRGSSAVGVINGLIYVAGGLRGTAQREFCVFDPALGQWQELDDIPRPIDHAAFGVVDGKLIIAGGRNTSIGQHVPDVDIYDPQSRQWSAGAPMPTSRAGGAFSVMGGRLYVFGGEGSTVDPDGVFPQAEAYDPGLNQWFELEPMPIPRHGMYAGTIGNTIYVPGGATVQGFGAVDVHETYTR